MSVIPITNLPASNPLNGQEYILNVQNGTTHKTTVDDINVLNTLDSVTSSGNTTTNSIVVESLSATSIHAISSFVEFIDIKQYELSGFDVTGDVFINGNLNLAGLVDGRDIAADGAAIDNLESDVTFLSGAIDNTDLQQVTDVGNTTTNSIQVASLSATGNITTESSFISAGTDLFSIMTTTSSVTADVEIGGIDKLDVISPGTTIQDLTERLLLRTYYPTFVLPSVSLTDDISTNVEVGTLGFTLIANFNAGAINGKIDNFIWDPNLKQDDRAGAATQYTFTGATIPTTSQAGNTLAFPSVTIIENANTFNVVTNYAIGPQPKDSRGNNYDSPLPAGSVTSNLTFYGRRNAFYGVDLTGNNSAGVRALTNTKLNPVNGTTFTINIPAGATDVAFAYPDGLRNVNSVIYVEGLNAEIKGAFSQQIVNVDGANGFTGIDYKLYTFTPANPFAETATYIVTI